MCAHVITDTVTYIYTLCIDNFFFFFQNHINKLRLYPLTNQEVTKTFQTIYLYQIRLSFQNLQKNINKHLLPCLKINDTPTNLDLEKSTHAIPQYQHWYMHFIRTQTTMNLQVYFLQTLQRHVMSLNTIYLCGNQLFMYCPMTSCT